MRMICPECGESYYDKARGCSCGFKIDKEKIKDPDHFRCQWSHSDGKRCKLRGVISPTTVGDKGSWYCTWHYDCLSNPAMAIDKQMFSRYFPEHWDMSQANELWALSLGDDAIQGFKIKMRRPVNKESQWDEYDDNIAKGLIFLGKNSKAWQLAPEACKQAAIKLYQSGWRPQYSFAKEQG